MAGEVTFRSLQLDDNGNVIENKNAYGSKKNDDTFPQTQDLIFSLADNKWISNSIANAPLSHLTWYQWFTHINRNSLWSIFASIFLPIGYPQSVTSDYGIFQICDTIQALCSYLRGLLTTRSTLIGIGVGSSTANATSAIVQFIFRDLSGLMGNVLFSWSFSHSFGIYVKQWRLFADIVNDIALTLELFSPLFASKFIFVCILCVASVFKAMCGVSAGATRIAIAKHFAVLDNETDIVSKEGIQETFVTILGMLMGLALTHYLSTETGDDDAQDSSHAFVVVVVIFMVLTVIHVVANYYAVKSLQLNTLNRPRLQIVAKHYFATKQVLNIAQVSQSESVLNMNYFMSRTRLKLGIKIQDISPLWMAWNLNCLQEINQNMYCIHVMQTGNTFGIGIAYHVRATDMDFIQSFLISVILEEWLKKEGLNPNAVLNNLLPTKQELNVFACQLSDMNCWYLSNLSSSLCVGKFRYC